MFISFEGCDGSGKSTIIKKLKKKFKKAGIIVNYTKEPSSHYINKKISKIIFNTDNLTPYTELLLFMACRTQHLNDKILNSKELFICDRFIDSTIAYQGYGSGIDLEKIRLLQKEFCSDFKPDLTIFLDVTPEVALRRKTGRKNNIDNRTLNYHNRVYDGYTKLARQSTRRIVTINANRKIKDIVNDCYNTVLMRIN